MRQLSRGRRPLVSCGALRSAASAKEVDKEWFTDEERRLREDALRLDRERNRVNDAANELFRIAAGHRHTVAVAAQEAATATVAATKHENLAWEAVEPLAERMEAEHQAESVRLQMAEEERQTAPLRAARDEAAAALKIRYSTLAADERASEQMETTAAEDAKSTSETEAARAQENRVLAAKGKVRMENVQAQVAEIDAAFDSAVSRGDLPDSEAVPAVVLAESRTARRAAAKRLDVVRFYSERPDRRGAKCWETSGGSWRLTAPRGWRNGIATLLTARNWSRAWMYSQPTPGLPS